LSTSGPWSTPSSTGGIRTGDEVLELRRDRMSTVRRLIGSLTDESLADQTAPVDGPG